MFASKDTLLTRPSGGYNIARSVRLRSSATAYLNRTPASAGSLTTWTWSGWLKRGTLSASLNIPIFSAGTSGTNDTNITFNSDIIDWFNRNGGSINGRLNTTQVFRDPSAWYHLVFVWDTTNGTSSNRMKIYVNGSLVTALSTATYPGPSQSSNINNNVANYIGLQTGTSNYFDGYLTEINFIDGQALTPSSFGETDSITGVWKPKAYSGTYGTNGFELNFSDNSNNTAATIGKDYSGNGNNWTPNNISVTAGVTYDSMQDVPTLTSATAANFCTLNPLDFKGSNAPTLANANLRINGVSTAAWRASASTIAFSSQKIYCEITLNGAGLTSGGSRTFGIIGTSTNIGASGVGFASNTGWGIAATTLTNDGAWTNGSKTTLTGISTASGTVYQIAVDGTIGSGSNKIWFGQNGTWFNSGDPSSGTSSIFSNLPSDMQFIAAILTDSGYDLDVNFGQRPFSYTPPTGFVALNTYNLPTSTITNGAGYMAATLYTGTGSNLSVSNAVNGISYQPDLVWIKNRNSTQSHCLYDSVRGATKQLNSNNTGAEGTYAGVSSFDSGGFSVGTADNNTNTYTYVAWQWKAGTTSASNTNGSITSTVSVGATQGFSVVTYTGTGANATVGHGLGVAPSMIIVKSRDVAGVSWNVYHISLGNTKSIYLNLTNAPDTNAGFWNNTSPTSSVFSVGTIVDTNQSTKNFVAYCFSAVAGYSAFGLYTGNGSADGPFVYLGFRPRWILVKCSSASVTNWHLQDTSRAPYNVENALLFPNLSNAETSGATLDGLSNGFKLRDTNADYNGSGQTFIYMAFAENPFKNSLAR